MPSDRARIYGIPIGVFYHLWDRQDGCCKICERNMIPRGRASLSVVVDHDHESGVVRGLLCNDCNTGLGKFGDDPDRLDKASEYLRSVSRLRRAV